MPWRSIMNNLEGYLLLEVRGGDPEKFLNEALAANITLWDIAFNKDGGIQAKMRVDEIHALRSLAHRSGCRVRIVDKRGWPFYGRRLRRRQVLVAGSLFFLLAVYFLSTFVWVIHVRPEGEPLKVLTPEQILAAARAEGLQPGIRKSAIDVRVLEEGIERRLPQAAWIGIRFRGTLAEIAVVEKAAAPPEERETGPASIVAAKDGVIKDILVIDGEGRVKVGDTVRRGEILISGLILPPGPEQPQGGAPSSQPPQEPRLVRARGEVKARVWYEGEKSVERRRIFTVPTGRHQETITVQIVGRRYIIKGPEGPPYAHYHRENKVVALPSWRNFIVPVELIITTYSEVQINSRQLSYEEAVRTAGEEILAELKRKLPPGAVVTGEKIIPISKPEEETVRVRAWIETEEDIGQVVPLGGG
ncbi:MAG: sporulation protein YqfD [Moorella humiferrea]|nr:sporulation protein YqfD [Moorella humiferrea]